MMETGVLGSWYASKAPTLHVFLHVYVVYQMCRTTAALTDYLWFCGLYWY
jgi:hypothetical protein